MSPGRATDLVKGIIVDLDAALATNGKDALDERHSALASAMMLGTRLLGGVAINLARIATAAEKMEANQGRLVRIANAIEKLEKKHDDGSTPPRDPA